MNVTNSHATSCRRPGCKIHIGAACRTSRFAITALTVFGALLSACTAANADGGQSAISRWIREEFGKIEQQAGENTTQTATLSEWKQDVEAILRHWDECQYQDAVRLTANMVPPAENSDSLSDQQCRQFMLLLRGALMYEIGESGTAEVQLQRLLRDNPTTPALDVRTEIGARCFLAKIMIDLAKFEAALAELDQALKIATERGGAQDPDLLAIKLDRVRALTYIGRLIEARQLCDEIEPEAKELEEKATAVYAHYLWARVFLAYEEREYSDVVEFTAKAAEHHAKLSGSASRDAIEMLINLGFAEAVVRRPHDAERHLREAMQRIENTFGKTNQVLFTRAAGARTFVDNY